MQKDGTYLDRGKRGRGLVAERIGDQGGVNWEEFRSDYGQWSGEGRHRRGERYDRQEVSQGRCPEVWITLSCNERGPKLGEKYKGERGAPEDLVGGA